MTQDAKVGTAEVTAEQIATEFLQGTPKKSEGKYKEDGSKEALTPEQETKEQNNLEKYLKFVTSVVTKEQFESLKAVAEKKVYDAATALLKDDHVADDKIEKFQKISFGKVVRQPFHFGTFSSNVKIKHRRRTTR